MKTVTLEYVRDIFEGCKDNDYNSICKAGRLISDIIEGLKDIDVKDDMKRSFKMSLYRKFMRAYTRYIISNPNAIKEISIDCSFTSIIDGEYSGINEI